MALIKCSECGIEISDKASCCPNCGCPIYIAKQKEAKNDNMITEESCVSYDCTQIAENTNIDNQQNYAPLDFKVPEYGEQNTVVVKNNKSKKLWIVLGIIVTIIFVGVMLWVGLSYGGTLSGDKNDEPDIVDMGAIGNKITVDGTVAYVAGENRILVPYDFSGSFSECNSAVYEKSLKGCENPRLPSNETDDLPEEVAREIISFYGEVDGFWTSVTAEHANIEIAGYEPESMHYAGLMDIFFKVGADDVATTVYGYCLSATSDSTIMGLLVLYDVTNEFEFTDIEDTADPNYSSEPTFYDDVIIDESDQSDQSDNEHESTYSEYTNSQEGDKDIVFNDNIFSDLGVTYGEMCKKYGEIEETDDLRGGIYFVFEKSPNLYFFENAPGSRSAWNGLESDDVDENAMCFSIQTEIQNLFSNFRGVKSIEDAEQELGVSLECFEDGDTGGYCCSFSYQNYFVSIYLNNDKLITEDSWATIELE